MHAILIGATGATGLDLLDLLLDDSIYTRVDIFVRRRVNVVHEKLQVHVVEFENPAAWKHLVKGDVLFSCLGTTLKGAGSKSAQWKVDYDYQLAFIKAAADNDIPTLVLVSAAHASSGSMFFYSRMKGELEEAVRKLGFSQFHIFRPPLLKRKGTDRWGEKMADRFFSALDRIGLMRSYRPLPTEVLAKAMLRVSKSKDDGEYIYQGGEIWE